MNGILVQFKIFYAGNVECFARHADISYAIRTANTSLVSMTYQQYANYARIYAQIYIVSCVPIIYSHIQTRIIFDLCRSFCKPATENATGKWELCKSMLIQIDFQ